MAEGLRCCADGGSAAEKKRRECMSKNMIRRRFLSLCLVLAMMASFPGVAWADVNETTYLYGDLTVVCAPYDCWMFNPNNVSGKWATTLEGWAVRQYNNRMFPLVKHPSRVPDIWIDSGRNDDGREALVKQYRYTGNYWKTTSDGLLDIDNGYIDEPEEYNLYLDQETATLYLINAYLKGQNCIALGGNVDKMMGAETGALTIALKGENKIIAYEESEYASTGAILLRSTVDGKVVTDDLILTGDETASLEMECGSISNSTSSTSYGFYLEASDLIIEVPTVDIVVHSGGGEIKTRTAIKANNVTVEEGSSVSITLEDGSEGTAFDAQSVVVESGASLSVTMTNNTSLMPEQDDGASTVSTFAEGDSGLTLEEGAKLEVIVPSGRVDLSEVFTDASDFSNVTFEVDGLLVLPSTIEAEELKDKVSGSGNVLISSDEGGNTGTFYAIEDGNLKESEETVILGDIKVYTDNDEQVTENDNLGYTWTKETYIVDENGNLTGPVDGGDGTTGDDALNGNKANVNLFVQSPISPNPTDGNDSSLPSNAGEENTNDDTTNTASDDTIDVWTLTILRPNVVGDITIVQEVGTVPNGNDYMDVPDDEYYETVAAAQEKYMAAFEETNMEFTASTDCTVYGEVKVLYGGRLEGVTGPEYMEHESFPIPYTKTVGTLTFSGEYEMNVAYDISYGNAMVKVANTLTAASINTWKLELLETADLTLWQGAQLTTNNNKTRLLSGVQKEHHDEEWGNPALQEEYEQRIRKEFLARIENVLTIQDGAKYTYPATGVSPFYIMVNMVKYFDYDNEEDKERRVLINVFDEESYEELITPKIIEWEDGEHTLSEEWIELPVVDDYVDEWTNEKVEIIYSEEMDEDQKEAAEKALESVITVGNTFYVVFSEADLKSAFTIPDDMYDEMVGGGDYPLVLQCDAKLQKLGDTNGIFSLSIQRPPADGEEAGSDGDGGNGGSSSSSSGGSGSPLPTVDPDGGDGSETGSNETDGSSPDSGCSQPSNCVSDTLGKLIVNGSYQFKLTSTDGTVPTLTVDGSAFRVGSVSQDGNDYYVKIYAVGAPGAAGDVRVNGVKVAEAAVGSVYGGVLSDTTAPFTVRQGEAYQFRLTSDAMPVMTAGSSSFRVEYAGNIGRDWFYKVYAVGQVGDGCGFYVNDAPFPTAIAHITKPES